MPASRAVGGRHLVWAKIGLEERANRAAASSASTARAAAHGACQSALRARRAATSAAQPARNAGHAASTRSSFQPGSAVHATARTRGQRRRVRVRRGGADGGGAAARWHRSTQPARRAASVRSAARGRRRRRSGGVPAMGWVLLEVLVALAIAVAIVWWTMGPLASAPANDAGPPPNDARGDCRTRSMQHARHDSVNGGIAASNACRPRRPSGRCRASCRPASR